MAEHYYTPAHRLRLLMRRFGVDTIRYPQDLTEDRSVRLIRHHGVTVVLDVGAARGRYGNELRELGYRGRIVSFEPLASSFETLTARADRDSRWSAVRAAVSDAAGVGELNVAENGDSSSLLDMLPQHLSAAPTSRYVGRESTPVVRLDSAAAPHLADDDRAFLKISVQGHAKPALVGAEGLFDRVVGIQAQLSLTPLYAGEMLFQEGVELIAGWGYSLMNIRPGFHEHESGRTLQVDAVFFRE